MQYCSLPHRTLLHHQSHPQLGAVAPSLCFGSISSFFLYLFIHWSLVAYWVPADLGSSSFSVISFCLFILFMGFSRQEYWSGLPFPSPVDHVLSELSTMTRPSWVALHSMAHSFNELDKAVVHVIRLVSFLWLWFSLSALWWRRVRGLWKLLDGRTDWEGNWVLFWWEGPCSVNLSFNFLLMGGAVFPTCYFSSVQSFNSQCLLKLMSIKG